MSRTRNVEAGGFNWNQITSNSVQTGSNQFQNSVQNSVGRNNGPPGGNMFIENDEKPIDWSTQDRISDRNNYVELSSKKTLPTPHIVTSSQTSQNRINTTTWSNYKHHQTDEEEKPKTYGVEDTPGTGFGVRSIIVRLPIYDDVIHPFYESPY